MLNADTLVVITFSPSFAVFRILIRYIALPDMGTERFELAFRSEHGECTVTRVENHRTPITEHGESDRCIRIRGKLSGAVANPPELANERSPLAHYHDPASLVVHHIKVARIVERHPADPAESLPFVTIVRAYPVDLLEVGLEEVVLAGECNHFLCGQRLPTWRMGVGQRSKCQQRSFEQYRSIESRWSPFLGEETLWPSMHLVTPTWEIERDRGNAAEGVPITPLQRPYAVQLFEPGVEDPVLTVQFDHLLPGQGLAAGGRAARQQHRNRCIRTCPPSHSVPRSHPVTGIG